ncbi:MAG: hypothetical protein DRQ55_13585 [Planctomycetota bacterium]|nr:MAG: hypothetical protein DRQ55_13585 [Planctomycetota bacterium]
MTTFLISLALTVLCLGAVVITGRAGKRGAHYALVMAALTSLCWAIYEARIVGEGLVFEGAASSVRTVHFVAVAVVFLSLPLLALSGVRLHRVESEARRSLHRKLALTFLVAVIATCVLGTAMTLMATPLEPLHG